MADITTTAAQIEALYKDIDGLGKKWDEIARKFEAADLDKLLKLDKVSGDMQSFVKAVNGMTAAEQKMHRVEKELAKAQEKKKKALRGIREEIDKMVKRSQANKGLTQDELDYYTELLADETEHIDNLKEINRLQQPAQLKKLTQEYDKEEKAMKMVELRSFLMKKAIDLLVRVFVGVYNWTEKLQKNLGTLAERFGTSTDAIMGMAMAAKTELLDPRGLGGMGFELEEITSKLGDFREQLEFVGKVTDKQAISLVKYGMAVGLSAQQVGEFSRAIVIMGGSAKDAENFIFDLGIAAKKSGVTAASLSKQFMGAGKSLFELTGPKARQALTESARLLAKMGTGLDKLKGFIDMTDSFDQTAESVAALNTVFGTHINALEVFDELDPAKRMMKYVKALQMTGMNPDMIRTEKKFLMDKLQVTEETANAVLSAAASGKDYTKVLEEQSKIEEDRLATQKSFDLLLERGKKVLIAWGQLAANFYDKFESSGLIKKLRGMFDSVMDLIQSDGMASFVRGLTGAFEIIADIAGLLVKVIGVVLKPVLWLIGKFLEAVNTGWKFLKWMGSVITPGSAATDAETKQDFMDASAGLLGDDSAAASFSRKAKAGPVGTNVDVSADTAAIRAAGASTAAAGAATHETMGAPSTSVSNSSTTNNVAAAGGSADQTVHVQLVLDGEVLQDKLYKTNLRRNS